MPWLVDGDNLLGCWPGRRRSEAERRALTAELRRFARRTRRRVIVVFDGEPPEGYRAGPDVKYAGARKSADDVILSLLSAERDRRGWTVVTSDRPLGDRCRWLGARVERSHAFRPRLDAEPEGDKPRAEDNVAYWEDIFADRHPGDGSESA